MDIVAEVENIKEEMIGFRKDLHQCPEIAFQEKMTTQYIMDCMKQWGISYEAMNPTGLIATIGQGERTIALRADLDGLEVTEETELSFASKKKGYMHACGHDGHVAILLAAAKILKKYEKELDKKILLVFQPAEETATGAKVFMESGKLDQVDEIFALHIFSGIEAGKVSIESGPRMASTDWFSIDIDGRSSHAGKPHLGVDATVVAASMVMNLQTIVSRSTDPLDSVVVTVGKLTSGTARNIISGHARLEGTTRTFSKKTKEETKNRLIQVATDTGKMFGAQVVVDYPASSHSALVNDEDVVKKAQKGASNVLSPETFVHVEPMMLGEDFANYLTSIKGAFAFVGGGGKYPNHHNQFDFEELSLVNGLKLMLAYVGEA